MIHLPIRVTMLMLVLGVLWPYSMTSAAEPYQRFVTLSEQAEHSDAIALVERIGVDDKQQVTKFVIRKISSQNTVELIPGATLSLLAIPFGGELTHQLLFAHKTKEGVLEWSRGWITSSEPASEALWKYLLEAPKSNVTASERLEYFLKFFESDDRAIAYDVFWELDSATVKDRWACASKLPREKLRASLKNPEKLHMRRDLYAELLGYCGDQTDAEFLLAHLKEPSKDFRLEIQGYVIAYLWLTGEHGLDVIDELKLGPKESNFSECYAAMQSLRFMWNCGQDQIGKERLCQSMRALIERPDLADIVIRDLARWKDWSVQDRLMTLYGQGEYAVPSVKRATVMFLLICGQVTSPTQRGETDGTRTSDLPPHAIKARAHLDELRLRDPKTVKDAERFMFLHESSKPAAPIQVEPYRRGTASRGWGFRC